jgi:hypothetical protein
VRQVVKLTRNAINQALDVAEPRLEQAACDLEDFSRDTLEALRKGSLGKRMRKQLPQLFSRNQAGKVALIAAGLAVLALGVFRSS